MALTRSGSRSGHLRRRADPPPSLFASQSILSPTPTQSPVVTAAAASTTPFLTSTGTDGSVQTFRLIPATATDTDHVTVMATTTPVTRDMTSGDGGGIQISPIFIGLFLFLLLVGMAFVYRSYRARMAHEQNVERPSALAQVLSLHRWRYGRGGVPRDEEGPEDTDPVPQYHERRKSIAGNYVGGVTRGVSRRSGAPPGYDEAAIRRSLRQSGMSMVSAGGEEEGSRPLPAGLGSVIVANRAITRGRDSMTRPPPLEIGGIRERQEDDRYDESNYVQAPDPVAFR